MPVTAILSNDDIWSAAISFDDGNSPVQTPTQDLIVEYQYVRGNDVIVDWTRSPIISENTSFVPITTEYLGSDFFNGGINIEHTITFRVIDRVGNVSQTSSRFRLNYLAGE